MAVFVASEGSSTPIESGATVPTAFHVTTAGSILITTPLLRPNQKVVVLVEGVDNPNVYRDVKDHGIDVLFYEAY